MFLLIIALQSFSSTFGQNYFIQHPIYDSIKCNSHLAELFLEINFQVFEDQHSITLIDLSPVPTASVFKCLKGNKFSPLKTFDDIKFVELQKATHRSTISSYLVTEGFLINSKVIELPSIIKSIALHNPRTKLLVILFDENEAAAQKILFEAFHDLKMLLVSVLLLNGILENLDKVNTSVNLIMYNPYSGNKNTRKPQFINLDFTISNQQDRLKEMKVFSEKRTKNLQGFPLQINIFDYPLISKKILNKNGKTSHYDYVDGDTVTTFSKLLNFTPVYDNNCNGEFEHGFQYPNGTFVGSLAEVELERVDLAANPKFIADYNTSNSVFLQPVNMASLTFIIRKRQTHKLIITSIFDQFDETSRVVSITLSVLLPIVYLLVSRGEQRIINPRKRFESIDKSFLYILAIMNNISMKHSRYCSTRIVIAMILFNALIMTTLFQSTILKNLNSNLEIGKITTIRQLADEGYKVKMPSFIAGLFMKQGLDKVSWLLNQTQQTYIDTVVTKIDLPNILKADKKIAFLWSHLYNTNFLNQFYDNETGENLFEIVPETAFQFYISLMVPKNSPFIERFNDIMMEYIKTGIGQYHLTRALLEVDKIRIQRIKNGKYPKISKRAIKFHELKSSFQLYLILSASSCAVFMVEVLISHSRLFRKKLCR